MEIFLITLLFNHLVRRWMAVSQEFLGVFIVPMPLLNATQNDHANVSRPSLCGILSLKWTFDVSPISHRWCQHIYLSIATPQLRSCSTIDFHSCSHSFCAFIHSFGLHSFIILWVEFKPQSLQHTLHILSIN